MYEIPVGKTFARSESPLGSMSIKFRKEIEFTVFTLVDSLKATAHYNTGTP
jgi:hypothetical protein